MNKKINDDVKEIIIEFSKQMYHQGQIDKEKEKDRKLDEYIPVQFLDFLYKNYIWHY